MKLISMTDFVLEQEINTPKAVNFASFTTIADYNKLAYDRIISYANFLKQPLELWMFVPCDEDGNVLEEPKPENYFPIDKAGDKFTEEDKKGLDAYYSPMMEFEQAKERCLFEGFCFYKYQSTFVNSRNNEFNYCVFEYADNKLGVCTYTENKGFHTYFQMNSIEDLVQIDKGITLTQTAIKQLGL